MNIVEFRKLINIKDTYSVSYHKEKEDTEYVSFSYDVIITFDIIQKTKEFFKFENICVINNTIYKIVDNKIIYEIEKIFERNCKILPHKRIIILDYESITLDEILELKEILKCKYIFISSKIEADNEIPHLELKWGLT